MSEEGRAVQSSDETIERFRPLPGPTRVELLDGEGRVCRDDPVEARLTRPAGAGVLTIRIDADRLAEFR